VLLLVVFLVIGIVVRRAFRRKPVIEVDKTTIIATLESTPAPLDTGLRTLWADGRAMLRVISDDPPPLTALEASLDPAPDPKTLAEVAAAWNDRTASIRGPRSKSLTGIAFAGIIGFVALFGLIVLTQPITFAPLEYVSINDAPSAPGFVLMTGGRGVFVPSPFGTAQFITADDLTKVELCDDSLKWWTAALIDLLAPGEQSGVDCSAS
jgi:hypothetical protein